MDDIFARIGLTMGHLLSHSTVEGPARDEAARLIEELKATDVTIHRVVQERVAAEIEALAGKVNSHERKLNQVGAVTFSRANLASLEESGSDEEELVNLRRVFNGADPERFDHDGDGFAGGSLANPPTDDPEKMTIAQAKKWLDDNEVDYTGVTRVDDLRALVSGKMADIANAGALTAGSESATVAGS
jgi:hypothetical protein